MTQKEEEYYGGKDVNGDVDVPEDQKIIRIENIHKTYLLGVEGVPALRGVTLSIAKGEFIVVFGLSGGGKTTLMNIIGTVDTPTKGSLSIDGYRINSKTTDETLSYLRLKKIGFVFQTFNLLKSLTALENVELPMILAGDLSSSERRQRAIDLLTRVGMGERIDHLPAQLSGGEQQRVTIARAVANKPDLLLLDEPTGDLDSLNTAIVIKQLLALNKEEKITLVMVTHDVGLKNFADRVIWMRDGKIQSVEKSSVATRKKRQRELEEEYQSLHAGHVKNIKKFANTSVRSPTDYETHPKHTPAPVKPYQFSEAYVQAAKMTVDEYERETNLLGMNRGSYQDSSSSSLDDSATASVGADTVLLVDSSSSDLG